MSIERRNISYVLVTGGAGYIGSHTLVELDSAGYRFIVYDNLSNSSKKALKGVEKITGKKVKFIKGDIRDRELLENVFKKYNIESVIHFAGLKAVGESIQKPLEYYSNNVNGTLTLLFVMLKFNCKKIVFSSSATVYGTPKEVPVKENAQTGIGITNPYGRSKYFIEEILKDLYNSDNSWKIAILRYFNPIGAHKSGFIGEDPNGIPNNLMPYISQVAIKKLKELKIFGDDYPTKDGTGVRDYIHVCDLARAHVNALKFLESRIKLEKPLIVNIGTGRGYSVLEVVKTFQQVNGVEIPYKIVKRRPGDVAVCYAEAKLAKELLHWEAKEDLKQMCKDSWNWQKSNPEGYL